MIRWKKKKSFFISSPSVTSDSIFQKITINKDGYNLLSSPTVISEIQRKSPYSFSSKKVKHDTITNPELEKARIIPNSSSLKTHLNNNVTSPIFLTNQNNISSLSHNYDLPITTKSPSPKVKYINNLNSIINQPASDNQNNNKNIYNKTSNTYNLSSKKN